MKTITGKKVLIVDDSATMRMLLSTTIRKTLAVNVTEAVNGVDAIEKLQKHDFDLVLTDMNMPEMDGAQLVGKIRSSLNKNIPIIIITTKGEEGDRDLGLSLGANGYLTKPIIAQELKDTVSGFLIGSEG